MKDGSLKLLYLPRNAHNLVFSTLHKMRPFLWWHTDLKALLFLSISDTLCFVCKGAFSYILKFMLLPPLSEISVVVQGGTNRTIYLFAVGSPKKRGETWVNHFLESHQDDFSFRLNHYDFYTSSFVVYQIWGLH